MPAAAYHVYVGDIDIDVHAAELDFHIDVDLDFYVDFYVDIDVHIDLVNHVDDGRPVALHGRRVGPPV